MAKAEKRIAVVTGGNRGLGLAATRGLARQGVRVVLTARELEKARQARDGLLREGLEVDLYPLDVREARSVAGLADYLKKTYGRLDILINNAGVFPDGREGAQTSAFSTSVDVLREALETNAYGPFQLCQRLIPLMSRDGWGGRVVNVSSGMGQLSEMNGGCPGYRLSKTALNAVTRIFAEELAGTRVLVNSVCPGWVKTDMGGEGAELSVEEGVDTILWLALLEPDGPTGGFFRERKPIAW